MFIVLINFKNLFNKVHFKILRCVIPVVLSQNTMYKIMCIFTYTHAVKTLQMLCFDFMYM